MADETKENIGNTIKTATTTSSDDNIFVTDDNTDYTGFDYITSKSEDYLSMSSNELLVKARSQYDANYDAAIYNAHKFLQSACQHCSSVLDKTTDIIRAKGELLKNGINVFAQTPEPQPEAIGNMALVVPKLTAEEDFKNRYETPMGSESGGSSGSSSEGGGYNSSLGLTGNDVTEQIWNFLTKNMGCSQTGAAAIMGNMEQESTFDPKADNGTHHGLCQWGWGEDSGYRAVKLQEFAGDQYDTVAGQLQYLQHELQDDYYSDSLAAVKSSESIESIVHTWLVNFEGAPGQEEAERIGFAHKWYDTYAK